MGGLSGDGVSNRGLKRLNQVDEEHARQRKASNSRKRVREDKDATKRRRPSQHTPRVPRAMIGKCTHTKGGDPICNDFHLSSCSGAPPGGRCQKRMHVCCKHGCEEPPSMTQHAVTRLKLGGDGLWVRAPFRRGCC